MMDDNKYRVYAVEVYMYRDGLGYIEVIRFNSRLRGRKGNTYLLPPGRLARIQQMHAAMAKAAEGD